MNALALRDGTSCNDGNVGDLGIPRLKDSHVQGLASAQAEIQFRLFLQDSIADRSAN